MFGDSHSLSFLPAIDEALNEVSNSGYFVGTSGSTPFLEIYSFRSDQEVNNCHELNLRSYDFVRNSRIKNVFLVARWTYYTDGGYSGDDFSYIALNENSTGNIATSRHVFSVGL